MPAVSEVDTTMRSSGRTSISSGRSLVRPVRRMSRNEARWNRGIGDSRRSATGFTPGRLLQDRPRVRGGWSRGTPRSGLSRAALPGEGRPRAGLQECERHRDGNQHAHRCGLPRGDRLPQGTSVPCGHGRVAPGSTHAGLRRPLASRRVRNAATPTNRRRSARIVTAAPSAPRPEYPYPSGSPESLHLLTRVAASSLPHASVVAHN